MVNTKPKTTARITSTDDSSNKRVGNEEPMAVANNSEEQTRDASATTEPRVGDTGRTESGAVGPEDVLLGRGGATNSHSGNRKFRQIVAQHQQEYLKARKRDKVLQQAVNAFFARQRANPNSRLNAIWKETFGMSMTQFMSLVAAIK